jgi:hypothetical protein
MKSLLFQGVTPFEEPPTCAISPCRTEARFALRKNGRVYRFVARDKVAPEDPYLVLVRAAAFALDQGEPFAGRTPPRAVKDYLIKSSVVI